MNSMSCLIYCAALFVQQYLSKYVQIPRQLALIPSLRGSLEMVGG